MNLEIKFDFGMEDWQAFQKYHWGHSKQFQRTKLMVRLCMPAVFSVFILLDLTKGKFNWLFLVMAVTSSALWMVFYPNYWENRAIEKSKKSLEEGQNKSLIGEHQLSITDTEIKTKTSFSEHRVQWEGIEKVGETEDYFFLYNTAVSALIIPKKKFGIQLEEFRSILKEKINYHQ